MRAAALALWLLLVFGAAVGLIMVHITCEPAPIHAAIVAARSYFADGLDGVIEIGGAFYCFGGYSMILS